MSNSDLSKIVYEELVRLVAKSMGVPWWAEEPFENVRHEMDEKNNEVLIALDTYWRNLQACEADVDMKKIASRDLARKALYAALHSAE